jgi:hypothetical protein
VTAIGGIARAEGGTMKFALLIYGDEKAWENASEAEQAKMYAGHETFGKWLAETGWARGGEELHSSQQAKTVRTDEGESVVADGPFAETKEQLGGIYLIECDTLDQAVEAAKRIPATTVEVRPIVGENDH